MITSISKFQPPTSKSNFLLVMVAETVSLGVLSLPAAVAGLGLLP